MSSEVNFGVSNLSSSIQIHEVYGSNNMKFIVKRQCEYFRESPYGLLRGRIAPLASIGAGGLAGFYAGTHLAESLKIREARPVFQGTGAAIGCGIGAYLYLCINEQEAFFKAWKGLRLELVTNSFVFEKYAEDSFLNQFIDCLHYSILKVPVRLASGHLIDLDSFRSLKPNVEGRFTCPHTRKEIDISNPNIYLELHCLILKRIQHLLRQDLPKYESGSDMEKLTKLQLEVVESYLLESRKKHLDALQKLCTDEKMTDFELDNLRFQFYNHFGIDALGNAHPDRGVPAHFMNFDLDWKNILIENSKIIFRGTPPTFFDVF